MNKVEALSLVASLLALDTYHHQQSAIDIPSLWENTDSVITKNREVAVALDILDSYNARLFCLTN